LTWTLDIKQGFLLLWNMNSIKVTAESPLTVESKILDHIRQ